MKGTMYAPGENLISVVIGTVKIGETEYDLLQGPVIKTGLAPMVRSRLSGKTWALHWETIVREAIASGVDFVGDNVVEYEACDECGCTDIQSECWVTVNTSEVQDSSGDGYFCPQCDVNGDGDGHRRNTVFTKVLKPFVRDEQKPHATVEELEADDDDDDEDES